MPWWADLGERGGARALGGPLSPPLSLRTPPRFASLFRTPNLPRGPFTRTFRAFTSISTSSGITTVRVEWMSFIAGKVSLFGFLVDGSEEGERFSTRSLLFSSLSSLTLPVRRPRAQEGGGSASSKQRNSTVF